MAVHVLEKNRAKKAAKVTKQIGNVKAALKNLDVAFAALDRTIHEAGLRNKVVFNGDVRVREEVERREHLLGKVGRRVDVDVPWRRRQWAAECDYALYDI